MASHYKHILYVKLGCTYDSLVKFENILIAPRCLKSHTLFSHFEHFIQDKVKMKAFRGVIFIAL